MNITTPSHKVQARIAELAREHKAALAHFNMVEDKLRDVAGQEGALREERVQVYRALNQAVTDRDSAKADEARAALCALSDRVREWEDRKYELGQERGAANAKAVAIGDAHKRLVESASQTHPEIFAAA